MSAVADSIEPNLLQTPLHALHLEYGAKMGPFAGYHMPISYGRGILDEHLHCRGKAGLFDVSHMGQAMLTGPDQDRVAAALEALCPGGIATLSPGRMRYTVLLNDSGGVIDDLLVTRPNSDTRGGLLMLVVNASRKDVVFRHFADQLTPGVEIVPMADRALIALQGPKSASVLARHWAGASALRFMHTANANLGGADCVVSRCGYTGEDGFEISIAARDAESLARILLADESVRLIGLGARDTLRLEAGLCLYGHELDETISPVEAGLAWTIPERRRDGGFLGSERVLRELHDGPSRRRIGLRLEGRTIARDGSSIFTRDGAPIGVVSSGGFGASAGGPIAMGYVARAHAAPGTSIVVVVRGRGHDAEIAPLPFVPHATVR